MIKKNCLFCGKEFKTLLSEVKRGGGKYCSRPCYYKSRVGKKVIKDPEKWEKCKEKISLKAKERLKDKTKHPRYGKKLTDTERKKISEGVKRAYKEGKLINPMKHPEVREKVSKKLKGRVFSEAWKKKISDAKKGKLPTFLRDPQRYREHIERLKKKPIMKGKHLKLETRLKLSQARKGKHNSPSTEFTTERLKELWKDPSYRSKVIHRSALALVMSKPNATERKFIQICEKHKLEFQYVGDGSLWIGSKNPDFVHNNVKNKVIEIFGDYWHKGENPQERVDYFHKYGYDCLVIWEHELEDKEVLVEKLSEWFKFHRKVKLE